jgi:AcrR family transcriptional regulator
LVETGNAGLTLRKIAECANMRLSNVQYYFKSRDDVLVALLGRYFEECIANLSRMTEDSDAKTRRERVAFLVRSGLSHGQDISDMCRAFREIWTISSRNETINRCLTEYYRRFADVMADYVFDNDMDDAGRARLKTMLLPYFEGYSVTAKSLPLDEEYVAEMLTDLVLGSS